MRPFWLIGGLWIAAFFSPPLSASAPLLPRALWVWDATTITTTSKRQALFDLCRLKGVTTLFLYTGGVFMNPTDAAGKVAVTRAQLGNFNLAAHALGLKVVAVDGDPSYCLVENHDRVLARLAQAIDFNNRQAFGARLDGFQWDIEPHGLELWKTDASSRPGLLAGFLEIARRLTDAARTGTPAVPIGFATAFWFDDLDRAVAFGGVTKPTAEHLFDILTSAPGSHVAIMSYRDTVGDAGGTLDVTRQERAYAAAHAPAVRLWIGQETGDFDPPSITFNEEGPAALDFAMRAISDALTADPTVTGIAIHQYVYYRDMLDAQAPLGDGRLRLQAEPGRLALNFSRAARVRCVLEGTDDLGAAWSAIASYDPATLAWTTIDAAGAPVVAESLRPDGLVDVVWRINAASGPRRFFRIRTL